MSEEAVETWTIEMLWDCSHCGTRNPGMTGSERESLRCVRCGAEKTNEPWVMPDSPETAPRLTGVLDERARAGANITCPFCKKESRVTHNRCEVCGASFASGETLPAPASVQPTTSGPCQAPPSSVVVPRALPKGWEGRKVALGILLAGAVIIPMIFMLRATSTIVVVSHQRWVRERTLQEQHSYSGEGWRRSVTEEVYSWDHCEDRQRGTTACHPHPCNCHEVSYSCNCTGGNSYSCNCTTDRQCSRVCTSNRNGSATCTQRCRDVRSCSTCTTPRRCQTCIRTVCNTCVDQCPVMEPWCSYRYHRWDTIDHGETHGEGHGAHWPPVNIHGPGQRMHSAEDYTVEFRDLHSTRTWERAYSEEVYERFNVGQRYNASWTRVGGLTLTGPAR